MAEEEKEDRLSSLPDFLLLEIISRIKINKKYGYQKRTMTTKEVIRTTSTISKRWQHLWTQCPNLTFVERYDLKFEYRFGDAADRTDYFSFIDKTLTQCPIHVKLNKLEVDIYYNYVDSYTRWFQRINSWIHYAITRNVQEVQLYFCDLSLHDFVKPVCYDDELFFNNSCITSMILSGCVFDPPNGAIRWDKLKSLCMLHVLLDEDVIANILSGSPVLESLNLDSCYGFERIDVTSKSVKNLEFSKSQRYDREKDYIDSIEVNAPYILSLTINRCLCLKKLLLLNVSSLVKVDLDYSNRGCSAIKSREEELLKGLLQSLGHVNEITLGDYCFKVLSRLEATGFQFHKGSDVTSNGRRKGLF